ncbi:uncharacterized protein [Palaemon carinicauda]|uniref:uncharacterized protein n=1 Tax=Palaemon carinicauda TaxID=392227 RepID=UPI0035B65A5C
MAMPNLISQLNLYPDTHNLIRVNFKRILKECVVCRRYNQRPVKLNQSAYREFRLSPSDKPFGNVYLDYCGPFYVRQGKDKVKVWILVISCMFTRAVNLKICMDMTVEEFLRALSLHSFEYGVPQFIVSDLGTQIVAGANIVQDFLKDAETVQYLTDNNVEKVHFQQYYKGCSQLGGLVESVVKMTKHMIRKSIRNNVIDFRDFEYLVDFDVVHKIKTSYEKLKQIRTNLLEIYRREFMNTLIKQATDKKDRYVPVNHKQISIGDIVLIKDDYPMGIVKEVFKNINGEVTAAKVLKGKTNEITKRHVTSLIPLLRKESDEDAVGSDDDDEDAVASKEEIPGMDVSRKHPQRKAAEISRQKFKTILNDDISD